MPIRVRVTDGRVVTFPDGTTREQMEAALKTLPPPAESKQTQQPSSGERNAAALSMFGITPLVIGQRDARVEALPTAGGAAGGAMGGPVGAAVGGAMGDAVRQMTNRAGGRQAEGLQHVGTEGLRQGAYELGGRAISELGRGVYKGAVALLPKTIKQEFPTLARAGYREFVALTRRGAEKADRLLGESAQQAADVITQAERAGASPVGLSEVERYVPDVASDISARAGGTAEPGLHTLTSVSRRTARGHAWPISLSETQGLKQAEQDLAQRAYRARDAGRIVNLSPRAQYAEAAARGAREAIETRVPSVIPVNRRTQELIGLARGATHSAETGHVLSRATGAIAGGLAGTGAGVVPALGTAAFGSLLTTPGGLSRLALMLKLLGRVGPTVMRGADLISQPVDQQPPRQ